MSQSVDRIETAHWLVILSLAPQTYTLWNWKVNRKVNTLTISYTNVRNRKDVDGVIQMILWVSPEHDPVSIVTTDSLTIGVS